MGAIHNSCRRQTSANASAHAALKFVCIQTTRTTHRRRKDRLARHYAFPLTFQFCYTLLLRFPPRSIFAIAVSSPAALRIRFHPSFARLRGPTSTLAAGTAEELRSKKDNVDQVFQVNFRRQHSRYTRHDIRQFKHRERNCLIPIWLGDATLLKFQSCSDQVLWY